MFTPLTEDQYQKAIDAGFSSDQIIQNEKKRKDESLSAVIPDNPDNVVNTNTGGATAQAAKSMTERALTFVGKDLIGATDPNKDAGFFGGLFQSTVGSKGLAGLALATPQIINSYLSSNGAAEKNKTIESASFDLAHTTDELLAKANAMDRSDPRRQSLIDQANANIKKLNLDQAGTNTNEASNAWGGQYSTQDLGASVKDIAGMGLNSALTVSTFGSPLGNGSLAKTAITSVLKELPGAIKYAKYLSYGKSLIPRMVESGVLGSAYQAASNLVEDKPVSQNLVTSGLLSAAIPAVTEGLARGVKNVASIFSGVPTKVFEAAYNNPGVIGTIVRKFATDPAFGEDQLLKKTQVALSEVRNQRSTDYKNGLQEIEDAYRKTALTSKRGDVVIYQINKTAQEGGGELVTLSKQGAKQRLMNVLDGFGVKVKNGALDFSNSTLADSEESLVKKMVSTINEWNNISPTGLNDLAIKLGKFGQSRYGTPINAISTQAKKGVREYLSSRIPEVDVLNKTYAESSQFVDNVVKEIGQAMNGRGSKSIAISRLTGLLTKGSPQRQQLVQQLGERGGQDLINEIIGATLSKWGPRWGRLAVDAIMGAGAEVGAGMAGASLTSLAPGAIAGVAAASPRIGGTVARMAGRLQPTSQFIKKAVIPAISRR